MTEQYEIPSESFGLIHDAIFTHAMKIAECLKLIPLSAGREKLEEHLFNYGPSTFDSVLEGRASSDTPVYEWDYAFTALCRAIDEFYGAQHYLGEAELAQAWRCLLESTYFLGCGEGHLVTLLTRGQKGAAARHKEGPQTIAKAIVRECWEAWQKSPSNYRSRYEFAQDMLTKLPLDDRGDPVISYDTITKKWIPTWHKERM